MYLNFIKLGILLGFFALCLFIASREDVINMEEKIYIMPVGKVEEEALAYLQNNLGERFKLRCQLADSIEIPAEALNRKRRQYYSPLILQAILDNAPPRYHRILGVIEVDLYVLELNFIFGQADLQRGIALISLTRLRQEYYGLPADKEIFQKRMLKEAVHELGHTYGLRHCSNSLCVMYFSNSLQDTDHKGADFCLQCTKKLESHLKK